MAAIGELQHGGEPRSGAEAGRRRAEVWTGGGGGEEEPVARLGAATAAKGRGEPQHVAPTETGGAASGGRSTGAPLYCQMTVR